MRRALHSTALLLTPVRANNRSRIIQHHLPKTTSSRTHHASFRSPPPCHRAHHGRRLHPPPSSPHSPPPQGSRPCHRGLQYVVAHFSYTLTSDHVFLSQKPPSPTPTPRPRGAATPSTSCESAARARTSRSWCASSARSGFARRRGRMSSRLSADMGTILRMEEGMAIRVMARRRTARTTTTRQRPLSVDDLIGPDQENNVA